MSHLTERRKYQRCDNLVCKVLISMNEIRWENVELYDISAGGMLFASAHKFAENKNLHFNLYVYNMLSEFNLRVDGCVIRVERDKDKYIYAIKFDTINKYQQIQLDELIKSKVSVRSAPEHTHSGEEHSMLSLSRLKPGTRRLRIGNYK